MLIAEMCQNHNGSPDLLLSMVYQAASAGATHAKIQNLYSWELNFRPKFEGLQGELHRPYITEVERLRKLDLDEKTESLFVSACKAHGLTPMVTVFTHDGVGRAKRAGFKSIKIASYDCASTPLITAVLAFADEVVVSTGATRWADVRKTAELLASRGSQKVSLLHATTVYPNTIENANLGRINALREFGLQVGFSDHTGTLDVNLANATSKAAVMLGAEVVERHFTVLPPGATKDGPVSIDTIRLADLSDFMKSSARSSFISAKEKNATNSVISLAQSCTLEPSAAEMSNASYYRGRVVSTHGGSACPSWEICNHAVDAT